MANKKSYTQVLIEVESRLSSLETLSQYQENHLRSIDQHLEKLNTRTGDNEINIAKHSMIFKIIGSLFGVIGGGTAIVLKILGVY